MNKYINLVIAIFLGFSIQAQQVTKSVFGTFLLKGATIHTVTKGNIVGDVLIENGKIKNVGSNISAPAAATVIDCAGKHIYPGLIDAGTKVGLSEVSSVSLTNDFSEIGNLTPQVQALTAVNPNSAIIPVTRVNGVTTVIAAPSGGLFCGTAALISLIGYTPDQMYAGFKGIVMNYPSSGRRGRFDRRTDEDIKKDADKALKNLNDIWEKAIEYTKMNSTKAVTTFNPEMAALMPVVEGKMTLMIEVNGKDDIKAALAWIKEKKVKAILTGVTEGYKVAKEIAESGVPVITGPILSVPSSSAAAYDASYTNPGIMQKAGVKVSIRTDDTENVRNLPFNAGFAAAYGMGTEEALKAVTINTAEILGVSDKYGSIETGKMASLFVSDGDPFETKTQISHLFINGWNVPMESRHTLLYNEFLKRSPGL